MDAHLEYAAAQRSLFSAPTTFFRLFCFLPFFFFNEVRIAKGKNGRESEKNFRPIFFFLSCSPFAFFSFFLSCLTIFIFSCFLPLHIFSSFALLLAMCCAVAVSVCVRFLCLFLLFVIVQCNVVVVVAANDVDVVSRSRFQH